MHDVVTLFYNTVAFTTLVIQGSIVKQASSPTQSVASKYFCHSGYSSKLKMALISKAIVFLILAIIVAAYHGYQLQPCSLSTVSSFAASHLSRLGPIRSIRLYSAIGGESISADTVVARCTKKIVDSLNPKECSVTSTDDDPNGSHVSCRTILQFSKITSDNRLSTSFTDSDCMRCRRLRGKDLSAKTTLGIQSYMG